MKLKPHSRNWTQWSEGGRKGKHLALQSKRDGSNQSGEDSWTWRLEKKLVGDSLEKKRLFGPGKPNVDEQVEPLVDELEDRLDFLTLFENEENAEEDVLEYMEE